MEMIDTGHLNALRNRIYNIRFAGNCFFHWAGRKQLDLSGINKSLRKDYSLYCGISTNGLNMLNAKVL